MRRNHLRSVVVLFGVVGLIAAVTPSAGAAQPDGLDHFKCYASSRGEGFTPPTKPRRVALTDQFGTAEVAVRDVNRLCNPATKYRRDIGEVTEVKNPDAHLVCWAILEENWRPRRVVAINQFGTAHLDVGAPVRLCLPSWKAHEPTFPEPTAPPGLDHFKCYRAALTSSEDPFERTPTSGLRLADQFGKTAARVRAPVELCNPVQKRRLDTGEVTEVRNPSAHLVCFSHGQAVTFEPRRVFAKNQFGKGTLDVKAIGPLCLPSFKDDVTPA